MCVINFARQTGLPRRLESADSHVVVVLAGKGDNGAGGVTAGRYLVSRGLWVLLCLDRPIDKLSSNTAVLVSLCSCVVCMCVSKFVVSVCYACLVCMRTCVNM